MVITLIRDTFTPAETIGKMLIDRVPFCDTLEPPTVPNAQHPKGCIPQGWYRLSVTRSPKFGRLLPILHMVPGFEGIRIHAGNNRDENRNRLGPLRAVFLQILHCLCNPCPRRPPSPPCMVVL